MEDLSKELDEVCKSALSTLDRMIENTNKIREEAKTILAIPKIKPDVLSIETEKALEWYQEEMKKHILSVENDPNAKTCHVCENKIIAFRYDNYCSDSCLRYAKG